MQLIQAATGFVVRRDVPSGSALLGSCFAFRKQHLLLTAAHCVRGLPPESLGVVRPTPEVNDPGLDVLEVSTHPTADLALIRMGEFPLPIFHPFWDYETAAGWGDDVAAFGFPEDAAIGAAMRPTPRMFRASIQRFYRHESFMGYECLAAELSIGAPGGLSGGPVCWMRDQSKVLAVVAENVESSTYLAAVEELTDDGNFTRHETRNMINYAACVALYDVADWLDEHTESHSLGA